jgi:hypothetical protein
MIIVKLKGGLGNQLFQYAFGRLLSIKRNTSVKFDILSVDKRDIHRDFKLDKFNTKIELASSEEIKKSEYSFGFISKIWMWVKRKILRIYNVGYSEKIINSKEKYYDGYWQNYKYLEPIRKELLTEISLKESVNKKYSELISKINSSNSVSVHIRRGDYVNDPKTKNAHVTFGLEYYEKAIKIIKDKIKDPVFFVFSDDISWVKENLKINCPIIFVSNPEIKDYEELIIMSACKHNIIANSSFSFWGAWLNQNQNKTVIAPKKWSNLYQKEYKNICPENWIRI